MKARKALSLVLAICMIISLLPQFAVAVDPAQSGNSDGITVLYDFDAQFPTHLDSKPTFAEMTYNASHNLWCYAANSRNQTHGGKTETGAWQSIRYRDFGIQMFNNVWFAVKINVPQDGVYTPYQTYGQFNTAGNLEIYMFPSEGKTLTNTEIVANMKSENLKGSIDCYDETITYIAKNAEPYELSPVELAKGEYYVVYNAPGAHAAFGNLTLVSGDGAAPMDVSLSSETSTQIMEGDSLKLAVSSYMSNGETKVISPSEVTFSVSDGEGIASVDANGRVTGLSEGDAEISVEYAGYTDKITVSVKKFVPGECELVYDFEKHIGGYYDMTPLTDYTYEKTGNWAYFDNSRNQVHAAGRVNGYEGTGQLIRNRDWGMDVYTSWIAFKINVPKRGVYAPKQLYAIRDPYGGLMTMYMIPVGDKELSRDELTARFTDDNKIGVVNCSGGTDEYTLQSVPASLESRLFEAGDYYLVYDVSAGYGAFSNFTLDGIDGLKNLDVSVDTDIDVGETAEISVTGRLLNKQQISQENMEITYTSSAPYVLTVADGEICGVSEGNAIVTITAEYEGDVSQTSVNITVTDNSGVERTEISAPDTLFVRDSISPSMVAYMKSGNVMDITAASITMTECTPEGAATFEDGVLKAQSEGNITLLAEGSFKGEEYSAECEIEIIPGATKTGRTIYTDEMLRNAKENAKKYDWAKSEVEAAVEEADYYIDNFDVYYDYIIGEGIPRSQYIVGKGNTDQATCRYCGKDSTKVGGWKTENVSRPWKVQCPECNRLFPSNSFEDFVKLGIDEKGCFSRALALDKHREMLIEKGISLPDGEITDERKAEIANGAIMTREEQDFYGYGVKGGYLYNDLYSDVGTAPTVNCGQGMYETERVETWGVDDGWGYLTGLVDDGGTEDTSDDIYDRHCYIAYFYFKVWTSHVFTLPRNLGYAYMYTDDIKYGRAGAIYLDKIAEVWPSFYVWDFAPMFNLIDANTRKGKFVGRVDECVYAQSLAEASDMLFPALFDDPVLVKTLNERAEEKGLENDKSSGTRIWNYWEDNLLLDIFKEVKDGNISGNTGRYHTTVAATALALDREPESDEMFEWMFQSGEITSASQNRINTGGNISATLVENVDRDGIGNESGAHYNSMWFDNYNIVAQLAQRYGKDEYDLYKNPKFVKMLVAFADLTLTESYTVQIGDSEATALVGFRSNDDTLIAAFPYLKDSEVGPQFVDYFYKRFKNSLDNLHYDIYTKNPESLADEVKEYVASSEYKEKSKLLGGYGFAVLRAGTDFSEAGGENSLRDFWVYFGGAMTHKHSDALNLGIDAYGLNIAPDLGYPAAASNNPERFHWTSATMSHNTVTVNGANQINSPNIPNPGKVHHFDNSDKVKLLDVSQPEAYAEVSEYRRTVVMVEADDDVSYGVDFFRVTGGNEHTFSFHAQTEKDVTATGLGNLIPQVDENGNYVGSLAGMGEDGKGAPYTVTVTDENGEHEETRYYVGPGADPMSKPAASYNSDKLAFPMGYTWLERVRRAESVGQSFTVDFEIVDYRKQLKDSKGLHLKLHTLNDFAFDEVSFAKGPVPNRSNNKAMPTHLEYMIATRKGENLDSLFTSVYEPYKVNDYIESVEAITPERIDGTPASGAAVRAVKVTHKGGERTDYIIYSTDESVTYRLEGDDDMIFSGFVGVWTKNAEGAVIYSYKNGGDINVTGKVSGFTEELSLSNYIDITPDLEVSPESLAGKHIIIAHDGIGNAAYEILSASEVDENTLRLDIGTVTTVRRYIDNKDFDKGYIYNIGKGQKFVIPMTDEQNLSPVFGVVSDGTTSAGSTYKAVISATGNDGASVTITGRDMPRGASFDSNTNTFSWKPDNSQVGDNHISLTATDEYGRESVIHFTVTVYGATTGNKNEVTETPSTEGSGASGGGGGGGGGGAAPTPDTETTPDDTKNTDEEGNDQNDGEKAPDASGETDNIRFTDLSNHAWASDAINTLAEDGVIKGTTATTYSPANNITRADFASLLVRAFKLESDNSENFADVSASDYFATELAIARNTGIVNGIGDNKYAPRNTITRQDMMVIVYRALQKLNVGFGENIEPQYPDFDTVADYARDAVSALIGAGIVNGKSGHIAPTDYTTRAEVAVLIKRILDYIK